MTNRPTFVLIHGAWHNSSCWEPIQAELSKRGYESVAVDLLSPGSDPPLESHLEDVIIVRKELQKLVNEGQDIVLGMHSYGGLIGSSSTEGFDKRSREAKSLKGGVIAAIFCTAILVPVGSAGLEVFGDEPDWIEPFADNPAYIVCKNPREVMYHDVDEAVAHQWIAKFRNHPIATCVSPATYGFWGLVPCAYLICDEDRALPPKLQEMMIKNMEAAGVQFKIGRVNASHSFWLSKPAEAARFFEEVVLSL